MSEQRASNDNAEAGTRIAGLVAEFPGPEALLAAAAKVRDAGYRHWDSHSPFPIHGMERAMGIRPTILPWLVLAAGGAGAAGALLLQWWTNAVDYPYLVSGKPLFSFPANIPIIFELMVLLSAFAAFGGVLALNLLPEYRHPVFSVKRFARATSDGFFISIAADDPRFDVDATRLLLESAGAAAVEVCYAPAETPRFPALLKWTLAVVGLLALLPPLWIARQRQVPSDTPRLHIIQDMDFQPRYQSQGVGPFFADRRATRPPVPNAVEVGGLQTDAHFFRGQIDGQWATTLPIAVDRERMERGRERYNIYCAPCHGLAGEGDGMTHQRAVKRREPGWAQPRSLHVRNVREQPVGRLFHTITHGLNTMPGYAAQIPVADRWAIVLYVRALQRSQHAALDDVPAELRPGLLQEPSRP